LSDQGADGLCDEDRDKIDQLLACVRTCAWVANELRTPCISQPIERCTLGNAVALSHFAGWAPRDHLGNGSRPDFWRMRFPARHTYRSPALRPNTTRRESSTRPTMTALRVGLIEYARPS
jgi:hypothetical protein